MLPRCAWATNEEQSPITCFVPCRWAGQTDHRPPRELQTQDVRVRHDPAARLSDGPPAARLCPDAASAYSHAVPPVFTHAPAPPVSGPAPGSGPTGPHVPRPGPDTSPPQCPRPLPQSSHSAVQQAPWWFLHRARGHAHRGGRTRPQHHGLCLSR